MTTVRSISLAALAALILAAPGCDYESGGVDAGADGDADADTDSDSDSETEDPASMLAHYCDEEADCAGGLCVELVCTIPCDGPDWDLASCPDGALCHQGTCHLICDDYTECPLDTLPDGFPGGYMCGGPNDDYAGDYYTCSINPEDEP